MMAMIAWACSERVKGTQGPTNPYVSLQVSADLSLSGPLTTLSGSPLLLMYLCSLESCIFQPHYDLIRVEGHHLSRRPSFNDATTEKVVSPSPSPTTNQGREHGKATAATGRFMR